MTTMSISDGVTAMNAIVPTIISFVSSVLEMFMQPPLVFFTGAAFAVVAFKIAAYLLRQARSA